MPCSHAQAWPQLQVSCGPSGLFRRHSAVAASVWKAHIGGSVIPCTRPSSLSVPPACAGGHASGDEALDPLGGVSRAAAELGMYDLAGLRQDGQERMVSAHVGRCLSSEFGVKPVICRRWYPMV